MSARIMAVAMPSSVVCTRSPELGCPTGHASGERGFRALCPRLYAPLLEHNFCRPTMRPVGLSQHLPHWPELAAILCRVRVVPPSHHLGNQRGDARHILVTERDGPAEFHYDDAEAGHSISGIERVCSTRRNAFRDRAAEMLHQAR